MWTHCLQSSTCKISQHVQHSQSTFIISNQTNLSYIHPISFDFCSSFWCRKWLTRRSSSYWKRWRRSRSNANKRPSCRRRCCNSWRREHVGTVGRWVKRHGPMVFTEVPWCLPNPPRKKGKQTFLQPESGVVYQWVYHRNHRYWRVSIVQMTCWTLPINHQQSLNRL